MTPELFTDPADLAQTRRPLTPEEADKLPHLHRLLLGHYGQPKPREPWDPLTQLIYSLLSSRTKTPTSHQVMRDLERHFKSSDGVPAGPGNWEPVRDASVAEIERAIAIVTFPEVKAPQLKQTLQGITERYGSQVPTAMEDLVTLPGVGRKTANVVRSVAFGLPGFPVDSDRKSVV